MTRRMGMVASMLVGISTVAYPCGTSNSFNVDGPLRSAASFAERAVSPMRDYELITRAEVRLLPGLVRADSARFAGLVGRAPLQDLAWDTTAKVRVREPTRAAIDAAWAVGDATRAAREAAVVVSRIMALPAADDARRDSLLRRAVETIELAPAVMALPATQRRASFTRLAVPMRALPVDSLPAFLARNPASLRRATMEFAALRLAMRHGIPDNTREEIAKIVPAVRWDSLHAAHRAWLSRYPAHPYAGLVKFNRLRLFFLASQADSAWDTAMALYGEYPVRAAAEMRYLLLVQMLAPERLLTDACVPVEVRVSLVGNLHPSRDVWQAMMHLAESHRDAPWSENLEERLLATLAADSLPRVRLPQGYPAWRSTASPLWRYMWATNMLHAGQLDDAVKFTAVRITLKQDSLLAPDAAMLTARIHMARGDWVAAATTAGIDVWTRRYIVRTLAPDSLMPRITAVADAAVAREAQLVLAVRSAPRGTLGRCGRSGAVVRRSTHSTLQIAGHAGQRYRHQCGTAALRNGTRQRKRHRVLRAVAILLPRYDVPRLCIVSALRLRQFGRVGLAVDASS